MKASRWIGYFGRTMLSDTAPERAWDRFAGSYKLDSFTPEPIPNGDHPFRPDREIRLGEEIVYIWVDGPHHWSDRKRRDDRWVSEKVYEITKRRSFRVDSELLEDERYWPDVASRLGGFLLRDTLIWFLFER